MSNGYKRSVIVDGSDKYPSIIAAATAYRIPSKTLCNALARNGRYERGGHTFAYNKGAEPEPSNCGAPVRCIESGQEFIGIRTAAKSVNRSYASIYTAITNGTRCAGMHWEYV